jgi:hypothetical protein
MRSLLTALLLLASAGPALAQFPFGPARAAPGLAARGFITDRAAAERAIAFRPFLPVAAPDQVALLPPFHGAAVSANEGIGYAYGGWILQEWPRNGGSLADFAPLPGQPPCTDVRAVGGNEKPRGVVWTTPRGLVMALTPLSGDEPRAIFVEFRRLVRRGACR